MQVRERGKHKSTYLHSAPCMHMCSMRRLNMPPICTAHNSHMFTQCAESINQQGICLCRSSSIFRVSLKITGGCFRVKCAHLLCSGAFHPHGHSQRSVVVFPIDVVQIGCRVPQDAIAHAAVVASLRQYSHNFCTNCPRSCDPITCRLSACLSERCKTQHSVRCADQDIVRRCDDMKWPLVGSCVKYGQQTSIIRSLTDLQRPRSMHVNSRGTMKI